MNASRGWRLGLGPVFAFECVALSRRWQWYALRTCFVGALLVALLVILAKPGVPTELTTYSDLAKLGEKFFIAVIGTQLTLVLLAAPAATAGAICLDRASGMMTHVLVTDLSDVEIVLGKLAARLLPVLGLVACAFPLLAILTLIGGVDPHALFGAFLVTVGVALLGCSLAFWFSLWSKKTHEALLGTYAVWGLWLLARPFLVLVNRAFGWSWTLPSRLADPYYLTFSSYWAPGAVTYSDYAWFLVIVVAAAVALAALAVFKLRAVCTRVNLVKKPRQHRQLETIGRWLDPMRLLPGPSLDANPVLWREWRRARPSRLGRFVGGLFLVGAATASLAAILAPRGSFAMAWVNGLQVSIGMLLLSVTAATALAEERVRGSLDVLMTTPLSTREIVLGKWLGTVRLVPSLAVLPVLVVLCGGPWRSDYLPIALFTLVFVLVCGTAIASLGLALATWCARLGRAVALTVTAYVLMAVGWLFLGMWIHSGPDGEGLMMGSPFYFAGLLAADLCNLSNERNHFGWARLWTTVYGVAAFAFLQATLSTFNRCLGRIDDGIPSPGRKSQRADSTVNGVTITGDAFDRP